MNNVLGFIGLILVVIICIKAINNGNRNRGDRNEYPNEPLDDKYGRNNDRYSRRQDNYSRNTNYSSHHNTRGSRYPRGDNYGRSGSYMDSSRNQYGSRHGSDYSGERYLDRQEDRYYDDTRSF